MSGPEHLEEEVPGRLTEACDRQIETLQGMLRVHDELLGPLSLERDEESDSLLRLRKVYHHVGAVTSWGVDRWAIHVMAPEIRAALEQLRPLVRGGVCTEVHGPGGNCRLLRCFDKWDEELTPFTHPTIMSLALVPEARGSSKGDEVRSLFRLCALLHALLLCYSSALDVEIFRLDSGVAGSATHAAVERADPRTEIELAGKYFRAEGDSQPQRRRQAGNFLAEDRQ